MSEKFKKIISILLAYKFEFIVASDNESNMYFAYHNDKNGKTVWKINDEVHKGPSAIYNGAYHAWINTKGYSVADCISMIDAICCDYIS